MTQLRDMSREGDDKAPGQDAKIIVEFFPELSQVLPATESAPRVSEAQNLPRYRQKITEVAVTDLTGKGARIWQKQKQNQQKSRT